MEGKEHCKKKKELKIKISTKANPACPTKISACDIPYTITRPGPYILCDNIVPPRNNLPPINIEVSDVTLDLGGHTIDLQYRASVGVFISGPGGVVINNVVVKNGTIKNTIGVNGPNAPAVAIANDVTFPLVAVVAGVPLPVGPSASYPLTSIPITVAGILAYKLNGAIFRNITMYNVLYGIVTLQTVGYVRVDKCKLFNFGLTVPSTTSTPVAYGTGVFLAGTPSAPAVDLRMTNCDLNSQLSKFATVVFSADGCVWEYNATSSDAGPNPSPTGNPLIQGPVEFINCSAGVVRDCESRGSNTMLEAQYCEAFEFIDCTAWEIFHNGIGILFCSDVVIKGCIVHRAEGSTADPNVATGSGIKVNISNYVTLEDNVFTGFNIGTSATDSNGAGIAVAAANYAVIEYNKTSGNNWGIKEIATTTLTQNSVPYTFHETVPFSNNYISNFSNANVNNTGGIGDNYLLLPPYNAIIVSISANGTAPVAPYVNLEP